MVTNAKLQEQIAKVRRWTDLETRLGPLWGHHPNWKGAHPLSDKITVPNWPTNLDVARELEIEDAVKFVQCLCLVMGAYPWDFKSDITALVFYTSRQWSLAWLLYKGYRWADCDSCEGEPHGVSEDCTDCNGDGGEWEKVG